MKVQTSIFRSMSFAAAALAAVAGQAQAQPAPASYIECSGTNVAARYERSGLSSSLLINVGRAAYRSGDGGPLEETTVLGNLLTLTTNVVPDAYTDNVTLLLPDVIVDGAQPLTFRTWLFTTRTITSFGGPQITTGVIQSSRSVGMSCTAKAPPM